MAQAPLSRDAAFDVLSWVNAVAVANPHLGAASSGRIPSIASVAVDAMARAGTPRPTARSRMQVVRDRFPDEWAAALAGRLDGALHRPAPILPPPPPPPEPSVEDPEEPKPEPQPRTLDDDMKARRAQADQAALRANLREALDRIRTLEADNRELLWANTVPLAPPDWTVRATTGDKSEHIPLLITSDFQIGEVIRPQETDHAHGYDVETFRRRYRKLIERTIHLCFHHQPNWTYPGIIYERLGDTISGAIHEELAETDEVTPIDAVIVAAEEESAGVRKLADAFGQVLVMECGGGNHDRNTHKPRSKNAGGHSFDRLVSYILRREFKDDPRVVFQTTESPDIYFPVYDVRVLATHGDKIGSRGGQGFVGSSATVARGAQKVIMEQQALGRRVDEVHMGHFHSFVDLDFAICNGCLPGYSEYAKLNRMRPTPPLQVLAFYAPNYGRVCTKRIFLEPPRAVEPED
jgi:hypothetical protein